jgi:O-antigen/teichoic acid export membrane protein
MSSVPLEPERAEIVHGDPDPVASAAAGPMALRGSLLRSGGYVATVLLSVVSVPLLIRHLGIAQFGRYTTVIAIATIVGGLTDAGLVNIALREWTTRTGADRSRVMRSLLGLRLELSAAGVLAGTLFALVAGYNGTLVVGTLIASCGVLLQSTANLLTAALQGELRFGWAAVIDISRQAMAVALIVILIVAGAHLLAFFAVTIPAGLVTLALTGRLVRRRMPLAPRLRGPQRWPLIRETLPYAAAIAVNTLYFRVTIIAMSLIATALQTGYFATSFRVTEVLVGVPALAIGAAFPILSRAAAEDGRRFAYAAERILELALVAGTALALGVVLSAPFVIAVLAGHKGAPAVPVLQIQGTALIGTFLAVATGFALLALRRHSALLIANGAALVTNLVLTLVLVPIDQAQGAAIAAVAAESALAIGQLLLLLRVRRTRLRVWPVIAIALGGLAGASMLLISGLHPLFRTAAGLAIFAGVIVLLGVRPPELMHALERRQPPEPVR